MELSSSTSDSHNGSCMDSNSCSDTDATTTTGADKINDNEERSKSDGGDDNNYDLDSSHSTEDAELKSRNDSEISSDNSSEDNSENISKCSSSSSSKSETDKNSNETFSYPWRKKKKIGHHKRKEEYSVTSDSNDEAERSKIVFNMKQLMKKIKNNYSEKGCEETHIKDRTFPNVYEASLNIRSPNEKEREKRKKNKSSPTNSGSTDTERKKKAHQKKKSKKTDAIEKFEKLIEKGRKEKLKKIKKKKKRPKDIEEEKTHQPHKEIKDDSNFHLYDGLNCEKKNSQFPFEAKTRKHSFERLNEKEDILNVQNNGFLVDTRFKENINKYEDNAVDKDITICDIKSNTKTNSQRKLHFKRSIKCNNCCKTIKQVQLLFESKEFLKVVYEFTQTDGKNKCNRIGRIIDIIKNTKIVCCDNLDIVHFRKTTVEKRLGKYAYYIKDINNTHLLLILHEAPFHTKEVKSEIVYCFRKLLKIPKEYAPILAEFLNVKKLHYICDFFYKKGLEKKENIYSIGTRITNINIINVNLFFQFSEGEYAAFLKNYNFNISKNAMLNKKFQFSNFEFICGKILKIYTDDKNDATELLMKKSLKRPNTTKQNIKKLVPLSDSGNFDLFEKTETQKEENYYSAEQTNNRLSCCEILNRETDSYEKCDVSGAEKMEAPEEKKDLPNIKQQKLSINYSEITNDDIENRDDRNTIQKKSVHVSENTSKDGKSKVLINIDQPCVEEIFSEGGHASKRNNTSPPKYCFKSMIVCSGNTKTKNFNEGYKHNKDDFSDVAENCVNEDSFKKKEHLSSDNRGPKIEHPIATETNKDEASQKALCKMESTLSIEMLENNLKEFMNKENRNEIVSIFKRKYVIDIGKCIVTEVCHMDLFKILENTSHNFNYLYEEQIQNVKNYINSDCTWGTNEIYVMNEKLFIREIINSMQRE